MSQTQAPAAWCDQIHSRGRGIAVAPADGMETNSRIAVRATSILTDTGYFLADTGYWKVAIVTIAAAFLVMLLFTHGGSVVSVGKGAVVAFSKARQLLHDADRENRNLRPVPFSLANAELPRIG